MGRRVVSTTLNKQIHTNKHTHTRDKTRDARRDSYGPITAFTKHRRIAHRSSAPQAPRLNVEYTELFSLHSSLIKLLSWRGARRSTPRAKPSFTPCSPVLTWKPQHAPERVRPESLSLPQPQRRPTSSVQLHPGGKGGKYREREDGAVLEEAGEALDDFGVGGALGCVWARGA